MIQPIRTDLYELTVTLYAEPTEPGTKRDSGIKKIERVLTYNGEELARESSRYYDDGELYKLQYANNYYRVQSWLKPPKNLCFERHPKNCSDVCKEIKQSLSLLGQSRSNVFNLTLKLIKLKLQILYIKSHISYLKLRSHSLSGVTTAVKNEFMCGGAYDKH